MRVTDDWVGLGRRLLLALCIVLAPQCAAASVAAADPLAWGSPRPRPRIRRPGR